MPAKRIILLNRLGGRYRFVLRADVPAGNQIAYRNPATVSVYDNASPAELQEVRDGLVLEKLCTLDFDAPVATINNYLETCWAAWQAEVTAEAAWSDYGRYWNGTLWTASAGVPMASAKEVPEGLPSYVALTPVSAFGANKFHLVLYNGAATATGQALIVKVRLLVVLPGLAAVTGAAPSVWSLRRRSAPTTAPSGAGSFAVTALDSSAPLPAIVTAWNAPGTPPAGGTVAIVNEFVPQADELKLTTADAPTLAALFSGWGGLVVYRASDVCPARPLTLRAGETLEVQQSATAGTGNCRILCLFTVG